MQVLVHVTHQAGTTQIPPPQKKIHLNAPPMLQEAVSACDTSVISYQ